MRSQVLKLLLILNICFWIAVSFAWWHYSAGFPQQVVSTVIVLGILSVVANLLYWGWLLFSRQVFWPAGHRYAQGFILLSSIIQLLLILFFVQ